MGKVTARCPHCGTNRDVDEKFIRSSVTCIRCRRTFSVQAALSAWKRLAGQVVDGKYHLRELLGEGAFALVFRAEEIAAGQVKRSVAVKLIYPSPDLSRDKQAEELIAILRMAHPCIVHGIDAGACDLDNTSWLYLVMELAEETLEERLHRSLLHPSEAWEFTEQIASALAYLHKDPDRLVHRDMKPANTLRFGNAWKLADFGLAYTMEWTKNVEKQPGGTERYMPPESIEGMISPAWDMWGFGVMLTEALTGRHPFENDQHILFAITQMEPELPADLPTPFLEIIRGCLIKKRSLRWTAPQVISTLQASRGMRASLAAFRWTITQHLKQHQQAKAKVKSGDSPRNGRS